MNNAGGNKPPQTAASGPTSPPAEAAGAGRQLGSLRCDEALRAAVGARLSAFAQQSAHTGEAPGLRRAAVAMVVAESGHGADLPGMPVHADWSREAALILTRRPGGMRRHANQWALPGGRMDHGETPEQTALRELTEEVGLRLDRSALLGRLDDYVTRSGFVITPLVFWGGAAPGLCADPDEVESIHRIPVAELLRPDAPMLEHTDHGPHPVLRMPVGDSWIAAPTAALLYQFRELVVFGRPTRVAHFDQPAFAWT